jgi:hypothetical protein
MAGEIINLFNGLTISSSAPVMLMDFNIITISEIIRNILKRSWAATKLALNMVKMPPTKLPLNIQPIINVKIIVGITTLRRNSIVTITVSIPIT